MFGAGAGVERSTNNLPMAPTVIATLNGAENTDVHMRQCYLMCESPGHRRETVDIFEHILNNTSKKLMSDLCSIATS